MTYADKLLDPRWQKRRLEILQRDNWICQWCCDDSETLHIHHIRYKKNANPWDYDDSDLVTVCRSCHKIYEDYKKIHGIPRFFHTRKIHCIAEEHGTFVCAMSNTGLFFSSPVTSICTDCAYFMRMFLDRVFQEEYSLTID